MTRNETLAEAFKKGRTSAKFRGKTYILPEWQLTGTVSQCITYVKSVTEQIKNGQYKIENQYIKLL